MISDNKDRKKCLSFVRDSSRSLPLLTKDKLEGNESHNKTEVTDIDQQIYERM